MSRSEEPVVSRININIITVRSDESGPKLFRSKDLGATGGLSAKATHAADRRTGGCEEKQTQVTAVEFKDQANRFYALHKYEDAIACYSRAIVSPSLVVA